MRTLTGIVENGTVRLPPNTRVRDGARALVVILGRKRRQPLPTLDPRIEAEDAEFVEACRGSIVEAMRAEET
ncbi:MAG: hypothetical protein FJ291_24550 [Planctomycetes bacterium]|nr:hypothetical protein [Planctomycetota bacterium]